VSTLVSHWEEVALGQHFSECLRAIITCHYAKNNSKISSTKHSTETSTPMDCDDNTQRSSTTIERVVYQLLQELTTSTSTSTTSNQSDASSVNGTSTHSPGSSIILDETISVFLRLHPERLEAIIEPIGDLIIRKLHQYDRHATPFSCVLSAFRQHRQQRQQASRASSSLPLTPINDTTLLEIVAALTLLTHRHPHVHQLHAFLADCLCQCDIPLLQTYFTSLLYAHFQQQQHEQQQHEQQQETFALSLIKRLIADEHEHIQQHQTRQQQLYQQQQQYYNNAAPPKPPATISNDLVTTIVPLLLAQDFRPLLESVASLGSPSNTNGSALRSANIVVDRSRLVEDFAESLCEFFATTSGTIAQKAVAQALTCSESNVGQCSSTTASGMADAASAVHDQSESDWPVIVRVFALVARRLGANAPTQEWPWCLRIASSPLTCDEFPQVPLGMPAVGTFGSATYAPRSSSWVSSHFLKPLFHHMHTRAARSIVSMMVGDAQYATILFGAAAPSIVTTECSTYQAEFGALMLLGTFLRQLANESQVVQREIVQLWCDAWINPAQGRCRALVKYAGDLLRLLIRLYCLMAMIEQAALHASHSMHRNWPLTSIRKPSSRPTSCFVGAMYKASRACTAVVRS
jgi:hypothetical protein